MTWRSSGHWRDVRIWLIDVAGVENQDYYLMGSDFDQPGRRLVGFRSGPVATMFSLVWS